MNPFRILVAIPLALLLTFSSQELGAQSTTELVETVSSNNLTLKALKARANALGEENIAAISLADPEIEFAILAGSPSEIGRRKDFSITQSFDFATISGARKNVVLGEAEILKLEWQEARRDVMLEVRRLLVEIVCCNSLIAGYSRRLSLATEMEAAMRKSLDNGASNALDYNKSVISLADIRATLDSYLIQRRNLLTELAILNGGNKIEVSNMNMDPEELPEDFDTWIENASANSSTMAYVKKQVELSGERLKLTRSEVLPELSVGYMAELVPGNSFRGVKLGLSVPLWSASRKMRSARMDVEASVAEEQDAVMKFVSRAENLYQSAVGLKKISDNLAQALVKSDNASLAQKSYELGELSLLHYLEEMDMYYEALARSIEAERDYQLALAELMSLEL